MKALPTLNYFFIKLEYYKNERRKTDNILNPCLKRIWFVACSKERDFFFTELGYLGF